VIFSKLFIQFFNDMFFQLGISIGNSGIEFFFKLGDIFVDRFFEINTAAHAQFMKIAVKKLLDAIIFFIDRRRLICFLFTLK
jgi:hypothetical protein